MAVQLSVGHMYEEAWQIRGYEQFLIDTVERPAWAECLLDPEVPLANIEAFAEACREYGRA